MQIITDNTICFKSNEEFFYKEREGKKCNTVRKLDDAEKRALNLWAEVLTERGLKARIRIVLANSHPMKSNRGFERTLTDISEWEGLHIFSWGRYRGGWHEHERR